MTKTVVFTLQEYDVTAKKAGGNETTHAQQSSAHLRNYSLHGNAELL